MNTSSIRKEVVDNKNENFITTMDPTEHFPSEIFISIIQAALPSDETYSASLLDLTNVSQRWQNVLLCIPVLWSQLYIDETQPDFLALLSLSINLSDNAPLNFVLSNCFVHDWTGLGSLLLPTYERVISVAIIMGTNQDGWGDYSSALSVFFDRFGYPPNLRDLVVGDRLGLSLSWSALVNLSPTVRLAGHIVLTLPAISRIEGAGRLFDKVRYDIICFRQYHTDRLSHLRPLSLQCNQFLSSSVDLDLSTEAHLPLSEYLTNSLGECTSFEQLICIAASSLCSLTIFIQTNFIGDLLDCLPELCSLQALRLSIAHIEYIQLPKSNRTDVVVPALQDLNFTITKDFQNGEWDEGLAVELFELLTRLYPRIQKLRLNAPSWPCDKLFILESLPTLKDVELNLEDYRSHSVELVLNLTSVQTLRLDSTPPLAGLTAPNLCRLTLKGTDLAARFSINIHSLYYLVVYIGNGHQGEFCLDPTAFPGIKKLRLERYGSATHWRLGSFLHLVSIQLYSDIVFNNPIGDSLCVHFIYYPDSCPSLQELSSDRCFEWDLLFLMLQQRNFGRKNARKIQTVTMPFVPFAFREHFELLLAGKHSEGPSFISQTLEATREVIFDANIPGCICCLKNQRPKCTENIGREGTFWTEYDPYPKLEKPPGTTAPEIYDCMLLHEELVSERKKCYATCKFRRQGVCDRWEAW